MPSHFVAPSIPVTIGTPSKRLLELRLMSHYMAMASESFASIFLSATRSGAELFTSWTTRLSFQHEYVMDALLSFSAFTLRKLEVSDSSVARASHSYMLRAIAGQANQLRAGLNEENSEALFASSLLIAYTSATAQQHLSSYKDDSLPNAWFEPWKGPRAIAIEGFTCFHSPEVSELLEFEMAVAHPGPEILYSGFAFLLEGLDKETTDIETIRAYERAVHILQQIVCSPYQMHPFRFASGAAPRFSQLFVDGDPRACAITGYFFMLLKQGKKIWWLPSPTDGQFRTLIDSLPAEWKSKMAWAERGFYGEDQRILEAPTALQPSSSETEENHS